MKRPIIRRIQVPQTAMHWQVLDGKLYILRGTGIEIWDYTTESWVDAYAAARTDVSVAFDYAELARRWGVGVRRG